MAPSPQRALRGLLAVMLLTLLLAGGWPDARADQQPSAWLVRVTRVVDGDTLEVLRQGRQVLVRLIGVDTPETETSQRLAQRARQYQRSPLREARLGRKARGFVLSLLAPDQWVRLEFEPAQGLRDRHGRVLAYVYLPDGRMLNRLLVEQGMARVFRRFLFRYRRAWLALEAQARKARKGLWALGGP